MAEHSFREVMHEVNRLCMTISGCNQNCPLENNGCCGNLGAYCSDPLQVECIESVVMSWAAEHPEPVYPTWGEWFVEHGDLVDGWQNATNAAWVAKRALDVFMKPIPADIAEKLGLQPKEGV